MKATVTSKGQITIPQAIRRKLDLQPGTVLDFDDRADHLRATKSVDPARMRSVVGIARSELAGKSVGEWLDELRGPVELPPARRRRR
ncbi:MAG: AbrB/MazE/SpoVT family DNA-binding domain-containing protein [Candidatus Binatia bacterium]